MYKKVHIFVVERKMEIFMHQIHIHYRLMDMEMLLKLHGIV